MCLLVALQANYVFLLITLFSNILHNAQLQTPIANHTKVFTLTIEELKAFVAVIYARGVAGRIDLPLHDIWTERWGMLLCKSAMPRNPFCEIIHFLRFHVKSNCSQRLQTGKFALFSEVWNHFINNRCTCYKPAALSLSTSIFSLAKSNDLLPSLWHQSQTSCGKYSILVNCRQARQIPDKLFYICLERMKHTPQMNVFLMSCKLYKSGSITLTVQQGTVNKPVLTLCTMNKDIRILVIKRKHRKLFPHGVKPNTDESMYLTTWLRNTLTEPTHEGGQHIISKTHLMWLLSIPAFSTKITIENISRGDFIRTLAEELTGPQVQKRSQIPWQTSFTISNEN